MTNSNRAWLLKAMQVLTILMLLLTLVFKLLAHRPRDSNHGAVAPGPAVVDRTQMQMSLQDVGPKILERRGLELSNRTAPCMKLMHILAAATGESQREKAITEGNAKLCWLPFRKVIATQDVPRLILEPLGLILARKDKQCMAIIERLSNAHDQNPQAVWGDVPRHRELTIAEGSRVNCFILKVGASEHNG
jgi:hypothetical protein